MLYYKDMDIQSLFYILAIVCMMLGIVVLVAIIALLIALERKINDTQKFIEKKIDDITRPVESVAGIATGLARRLLDRFIE